MTDSFLKQHYNTLIQRTRLVYWPNLVHWLESRSPRRLFLRALLLGLIISLPWQCSRLIYQAYFNTDDAASAENATPLNAPGSQYGSITRMPNPKARRVLPAPVPTPDSTEADAPAVSEARAAANPAPGDHEAGVLRRSAPKYPPSALRNNDSGTVTVSVRVSVDGTADQIRVEKSSGFRDLDHAALDAVKHWQFLPKVENGIPVVSELLIPVEFKLDE